MIVYEPVSVLLKLGPVTVFSWGLMVAIAFLAATFLILREAEKKKFDKDTVSNLIIYSIIGALVGSRIVFVLIKLPYYLQYPLDIFKIWDGGVTSYGGVLGAILVAYLYLRYKKQGFLKFADLVAPFIPLGFAIGRIGCFLNWDDFGIPSLLPWAVQVGTDVPRHPTQIYLFVMNLVVFFAIMKLKDRKFFTKISGSVFFAYLFIYSALRLVIEPLRQYQTPAFNYIVFLVLGAGIIISIVFFAIKRKRYKNK